MPFDLGPAYIARCKCGCGGVIMAVVDHPDHIADVAKEVSEAIRDGYVVEHVTVGYVHTAPFGCQRKAAALKVQPELPLES